MSQRKEEKLKKFTYFAQVNIEAKNEEDAQMELINLMDRHDILWEKEE